MKAKVLFLIVFSASLGFSVNAQQLISGSLTKLRGQREVTFSIDLSEARIDGMTESMFRVQRTLEEEHADGWEDRWEGKTLPKLKSSFCEGENEVCRTKIGSFKEAKYIATYIVEELRSNGTNWGHIVIREAKTGDEVAVVRISGKCTEKRGSWEYRMFCGMKDSGKRLGQFFRARL